MHVNILAYLLEEETGARKKERVARIEIFPQWCCEEFYETLFTLTQREVSYDLIIVRDEDHLINLFNRFSEFPVILNVNLDQLLSEMKTRKGTRKGNVTTMMTIRSLVADVADDLHYDMETHRYQQALSVILSTLLGSSSSRTFLEIAPFLSIKCQ